MSLSVAMRKNSADIFVFDVATFAVPSTEYEYTTAEPPVLVARDDQSLLTAIPSPPAPVVSLVADGPAGTLPDLRGMSAREATQTLARIGVSPRMTGDGFVASQDPPAGSPLDAVTFCHLTLERSPARSLASAQPR